MRTIGIVTTIMAIAVAGAGLMTTTDAQKQKPAGHAEVVTLSVPEMDCAGCEVGVKIAANKIDGVTQVTTSSDTRTADVTFDPSKTNPEAIATAITKATGFKIEIPKTEKKT